CPVAAPGPGRARSGLRHCGRAGFPAALALHVAGVPRRAGRWRRARAIPTGQGSAGLAPDAPAAGAGPAAGLRAGGALPGRRRRCAQAPPAGPPAGGPVRPVPGLPGRLAGRLGRGEFILPDAYGGDQPLPESQAWQARLGRALLEDLGASGSEPIGRAAVHAAFMARVRAPGDVPRPSGLPRRLLVFGISAMPRQTLEALSGLSRWIQILVCVNNPCAHYWADIQGDRELLRARFRRQARRPGMPEVLDEDALHQQTHPLLASWGRQGRDFIGLLDDIDDPAHRARCGLAFEALHRRIDAFEELPGVTLLEQLQDDIRDLRPLAETRERWPAVDAARDDSLRFHVAHT